MGEMADYYLSLSFDQETDDEDDGVLALIKSHNNKFRNGSASHRTRPTIIDYDSDDNDGF